MAKIPRFPITAREQSVVVKIYRQAAPSNASGFSYVVTWIGANGRQKKTVSDLTEAQEEATRRATQMANGLSAADQLTRSDIFELKEARVIAETHGTPLLSALAEWAKARELVGPAIVNACTDWSNRRASTLQRIRVSDAVENFIAAKDAAKKKGSRTYVSKLKAVKADFADHYLDAVSVQDWTKFLARFDDAVTRNDVRKRITTLCRWAQRQGHLADGVKPEIEKTERAKEIAHPIGTLTPRQFEDLLIYFRKKHSEHLAALVIAGFCGVRADEIHGKRDADDRRQVWEHVHLNVAEGQQPFLSVSVAKENTPSNRIVHLCDAAVAWLEVCPGKRKGPVCEPNALGKIRRIAKDAKFNLPENCFRHSWITYRIALTGDKASTATEAGNSVKEIDRRYRVPKPKHEGEAWFAIRPK